MGAKTPGQVINMEKKLIETQLSVNDNDEIIIKFDGKVLNDAGFKVGELMNVEVNDGKIAIERGKKIEEPERPAEDTIKQKSFYDGGYKGYRVDVKLDRQKEYEPVYISNATDAYDFLKPLQYEPRENLLSVMLDTKNKVVGVYESAKGGRDSAYLTPYEVIQPAYLANSRRIILAHNHPSGESEPSQQDFDLTKRIKQALETVNMQLLDHIIIGDGNYTSFTEMGYL